MINYKQSNWNEGTNLLTGLTNLESGVTKCVDILNQLIEDSKTEKINTDQPDNKVTVDDFLVHQHSGTAHQVLFDELRLQIQEMERKISSLAARVESLENTSTNVVTSAPKTSTRRKKDQ